MNKEVFSRYKSPDSVLSKSDRRLAHGALTIADILAGWPLVLTGWVIASKYFENPSYLNEVASNAAADPKNAAQAAIYLGIHAGGIGVIESLRRRIH